MKTLFYSLPVLLCVALIQGEQESFTFRSSTHCDEGSSIIAIIEFETIANNVIECARQCSERFNCGGTIFHENNKTCVGVKKDIETNGLDVCASPGATYHKLISATVISARTSAPTASQAMTTTSTTTSTAVTSTEFTCPPDDTVFRTVTLSDDTRFSYRIFMDEPRIFNQAVSKCNSHGSNVLEVVTIPKFNFIKQLLNCSAYISADFWTNGVYTASTDTWGTLTGKPIPMTSDFWFRNRPNNYGSVHCVWIPAMFGHYMDDIDCGSSSLNSINAICEVLE